LNQASDAGKKKKNVPGQKNLLKGGKIPRGVSVLQKEEKMRGDQRFARKKNSSDTRTGDVSHAKAREHHVGEGDRDKKAIRFRTGSRGCNIESTQKKRDRRIMCFPQQWDL